MRRMCWKARLGMTTIDPRGGALSRDLKWPRPAVRFRQNGRPGAFAWSQAAVTRTKPISTPAMVACCRVRLSDEIQC
jgi:hypothetical protein